MKDNKQIEAKIREEIEDVRPFLNMDGGDIEFIKYEDGIVYVKLTGACATCNIQDVTLKSNIEEYLKGEIPEIKEVINIDI